MSVVLPAPKQRVFAYLSKPENLPRWATEFAAEFRTVNGRHRVVTPDGELFFEIQADERTGVIDMLAGPDEGQMAVFPARVVGLPGGSSAFLFAMFQLPGLSDAQFEDQHASLLRELENVKREFAAG